MAKLTAKARTKPPTKPKPFNRGNLSTGAMAQIRSKVPGVKSKK